MSAAREELDAASRGFTLEAVAGRAGVGIGTLYRHFPTRDVLIEAIYAAELDGLAGSAATLLAQYPAEVALRRWLERYAQFTRTKRGMLDTLRAGAADRNLPMAATRERISAALEPILAAGRADGSLRADANPADITVLLHAVFIASATTDDPDQAVRLLDLVVDSLRAQPGKR